jgi:hypothetical protein
MTKTNFRALCAELADSVELLLEMRSNDRPMRVTEDRLNRARDLLAQPEPVAWGNFLEDGTCCGLSQHQEDIARWINPRPLFLSPHPPSALAQPEPQGPTDEELIRAYQAAYQPAWERGEYYGCHVDGLRAVLARWGRPAIEPVPVSERLPGPEDCDAAGRCWWFSPPAWGPRTIRPCWTFDSETLEGDTHWLPRWALPVPGVEGEP